MRKEYPKRQEFSSNHICECSHADANHEVDFFKDLPSLWKKNHPLGQGNCRICTCPKFKLDKDLPNYIPSKEEAKK